MGLKNPQKLPLGQELGSPAINPIKRRILLFVRIAMTAILLSLLFWFVYEVVNNRSMLRSNTEELALMQEEERLLNIENEQLRSYSDDENHDAYIERYARDEMGYADPHERVYYIVPGN